MAGKIIKKITDRKLFQSIFLKLFLDKNVFLKTDKETIPIQFLNYEAGIATLKIPAGHDLSGTNIVFVERTKDIVFSQMKLKESKGPDKYDFEIIDIQLMEYVKNEEPPKPFTDIRSEPRNAQIYLSNIISDFSLSECLKNSVRRVEYLRQEILKKLNLMYPFASVSFLHDKKPNPRMDFFQNERRPYFFPELKSYETNHDNKDHAYFMTNIYPKDLSITDNKLNSEICVPILYKLMLPFGYIQVNSQKQLTEKDYSAIRKLGMSASVLFTNDPIIIKSADDIISIADISQSGLGIIFKDKPLIKHFKDNSAILFNIIFPDNKKAITLAIVRHISLIENKIYRVGTEILNIDPIGEVNYTDYIESLNKPKNAV
jgi:hypothetical protein